MVRNTGEIIAASKAPLTLRAPHIHVLIRRDEIFGASNKESTFRFPPDGVTVHRREALQGRRNDASTALKERLGLTYRLNFSAKYFPVEIDKENSRVKGENMSFVFS